MNALPCDPAELARTLFEESPDALFLFDSASEQILDVNRSAEYLTGTARAQLLHQSIRALFRAELPDDELYLQYACRGREGFLLCDQQNEAWRPVALTISQLAAQSRTLGLLQARDLRGQRDARQLERQKEAELNRMAASASEAEAALRESRQRSEELYAQLWQRSLAGAVRVTATGRILDCNDSYARMFGYGSREDMLKRSTTELYFDPDAREKFVALLRKSIHVANYDLRLRRADGTPVWVLANVSRLMENGQEIFEGTFIDISDRNRAHEALRRSEARYRELWQGNLAGIVRASLDGRILDCNDSFARLFGFPSRQEMFSRSTKELYFDLGVRDEFVNRLREQQVLTNYEMQMRRADGSAIWVLETVRLLVEDGLEVLEGTLIDISDRKRIEEALRGSETNYRTLINHLDQAIFLKDRNFRYVTVNPVFCAGVGMSEDELRGKTIGELFPASALADKSHAIEERVLQEGRAIETEDEIKIAGASRHVRISRTPVKDADGAVVGVLGIAWDVTAQRELEAQLRHVQKMDAIGQLAGGIAHDFNNLLTIMLGNLSYVLTRDHDRQANLELLKNAERAGLRAAELTHTLLGFSHRAALATKPFNLNEGIDEVVRLTRSTLPANIALEIRARPQPWLVQADPGHMSQVLTNLTLNARDALPDGGTIVFETNHFVPDADYLSSHVEASPGEFVQLRVRDTGLGIAPELRRRIFEPFFTTKEKGKGTGLGLAIVFSIIKQHNGWIVCDSEPGRGTTFDMFLPRCQEVPLAPELVAPIENGRDLILLVDDEPMIRQLTKTILTKAGFQVLVAENGAVALEVIQANPEQIVLIILDAVMPRLSGRETLRELARLAPGVRVLFSSGYSTEQMGVHEFPQVRGFLPKPYRAEQLIAKVSEILGASR